MISNTQIVWSSPDHTKMESSQNDSATISDDSTIKADADFKSETAKECPCSYEESEKVLAYHNQQIYIAKVLYILKLHKWCI